MKGLFIAGTALLLSFGAYALDPLSVYALKAPKGCLDHIKTADVLDLPTLIQIGICNNPTLNKEFMTVKASEASLGSARGAYLPDVMASGNIGKKKTKVEKSSSNSTNPYGGNIALSWLLYDFGGRSATTKQTKNYLEAAAFTYNAALHDLVLSVNKAYFDLLSNEAVLKSAQETVKSYKKSYEETSKRYDLGMVSLSDKLLAKTTYQKSELDVITAQNALEKAGANLATLLNLPTDTKFKLKEPKKDKDFAKLEKEMTVQEMMKTAVEIRPELKSAMSAEEAARQGIYIARAGHFPKISLEGALSYNDEWKGTSPYQRGSSIGLGASVPLFNGFSTSYGVDKARYAYEGAQAQTLALTDAVKEEVYAAYQDYKTAVSSYKVNRQVLESAKESDRVSFASYQAGKESILNLLTAQAQLASARKEVVVSFYNVMISKANLYRAIGQF